jgi:hypothetical protein
MASVLPLRRQGLAVKDRRAQLRGRAALIEVVLACSARYSADRGQEGNRFGLDPNRQPVEIQGPVPAHPRRSPGHGGGPFALYLTRQAGRREGPVRVRERSMVRPVGRSDKPGITVEANQWRYSETVSPGRGCGRR